MVPCLLKGFALDNVLTRCLSQNNVQLSLVAPRKGFHDLEKLPALINNKKTEINKVSDTVSPLHVVQLAGLKLPTPQITPAPTPPMSAASSVNGSAPTIGKKRGCLFDTCWSQC